MSLNKRVFKVTSTTSYATVPEFDTVTLFNHVAVENYTDGEVYLAFNRTDYPDIVAQEDTDRVYDGFRNNGSCYVKNNTGTGGTVIITVWLSER